jgi:uncharacterized membrane protein YkvA (DUF1232 family)
MTARRDGAASRLRQWARRIKRDVRALSLAASDPRVPWYAKAVAMAVAAYALSPIDLIPDFVPVLGYLDDIVIVPLGILLAVKAGAACIDGGVPRNRESDRGSTAGQSLGRAHHRGSLAHRHRVGHSLARALRLSDERGDDNDGDICASRFGSTVTREAQASAALSRELDRLHHEGERIFSSCE